MGDPAQQSDVSDQLLDCGELDGDKRLASQLAEILGYTQVLFDDDENLTRTGNLAGQAKAKLRTRIYEVFDLEHDTDKEE